MKEKSKRSLVPRLRFPQFRKAPGWEVRPIGDYLTESRVVGSNGRVAKKLTVKLWGKGVNEKVEVLRGSENTQYYRRNAGQFIYSKLDFLNQAFGIIPPNLDGYESTVDLPCFDIADSLNSKFLLEYVQRKDFYTRHGDMADGGRKARRIQVESFLSFPIAAPDDIAEQQKIADCLTSLDELIAADGRKLEALRDHRKGLMQQLFPHPGESRPRLRFPEFRNAPEWEESTVGSKCKSFSGGTPDTTRKEFYGGTIPFIRSAEIGRDSTELFLTEEGLDNSAAKVVVRGDVLVALYGANSGDVALARVDGAINQAILCLRPDGNKAFLYHYLTKKKAWILATYIQGGQGNLSGDIVKSVPLRFPEPEEQDAVADCLSSLDALVTAQTQRVDALRMHKKGLMQQLFPSPEVFEA